MHFILLLTYFAICFAFGYLLGYKFKRRIPEKNGIEVGLASSIGIMILGFTIVFFLRINSEIVFSVCFGLASGIGSGIRLEKRS